MLKFVEARRTLYISRRKYYIKKFADGEIMIESVDL